MELDIEYYEYECTGCTGNGCIGHTTDEPIAIILDGVCFYVDGYYEGNYPSPKNRPDEIKEVKKVVANLQTIVQQQLSVANATLPDGNVR